VLILLLTEKGTRLCLTSSHTSQLRLATSNLVKREGKAIL